LVVSCLGAALASGAEGSGSSKAANDMEVRKLPGGAVLRFPKGTRFSVGRPIKVQLDSRPERTLAQAISLTAGRVEVDLPVAKTKTTAVLVQGPNKISAVAKGGHSVFIAAPKNVTVGAISGDMLVANGNDWRVLPSGTVREFPAGGAAADHNVLGAPIATLSAPVVLSVSGEPTSLRALASPISRAASYDFSLFRLQGNNRALLRRIASKESTVKLDGLAPGSYGLSVHALESSGLEGAESELVPVRVVAAELPDGAKLLEGGILLPPSQRVRLLGTEGVEVRYGRVADFVPLPDDIGLIRGQPTLVRLRAKGSKSEVALRLSPRAVQADIKLGPARARWPHDEVQVSVRLSDARGRPLADDVSVKPVAYVNVTPVKVEWKREHNVLTATVPPSMEPGPWVVRVEIVDDTGAIAGHDFLEVAMEPLARE
jgi:hypothetical protein